MTQYSLNVVSAKDDSAKIVEMLVLFLAMPQSNFQDDERESTMIALFQLSKDPGEGRSGVDAYLELDDRIISFELKTTSKSSVTTVSDFGPSHIQKWKGKHWLFSFYKEDASVTYKYATPRMMELWIREKEEYIQPDFQIAELASQKLDKQDLFLICGEKNIYTFEDAYRLQKKQYSKAHYLKLQDVDDGYSQEQMLSILRERANYIMERGSTLNNPHIPSKHFSGWEEITDNHSSRLRELVKAYCATL